MKINDQDLFVDYRIEQVFIGTYSFLYVGDKSYKSIGNRLMHFVEFNQSNEYDIREY